MDALAPIIDDDELSSFLMELSVRTRTAALRRDGGVGDDGEDEVEPELPGGIRATTGEQGAFGQPADHSVYGQPETVHSGEESTIPRSVSLKASAKKHKLFQVPSAGRDFDSLCFSLVGQGHAFCTARRCSTSHHGGTFSVLPGDLYVARTATSAFTDPKSSVSKLTLNLMVEWKVLTVSLSEWSKLFMLVNMPSEDGPTSAANLEARELFASRAEAHRTPRKRKASSSVAPSSLRLSPYTRQLEDRLGDTDDEDLVLGPSEILELLRQLDSGLEKTSGLLVDLTDERVELAKEEHLASRAIEHKVDVIVGELGKRPPALSSEYDAPTVWGSVGTLGSKLDKVQKQTSKYPTMISEEVNKLMEPFQDLVSDKVSQRLLAVDDRIKVVKSFALQSAKKLSERMDIKSMGSRWEVTPSRVIPPPPAVPGPAPEWIDGVMKSFETRLDDISSRVSKVTAELDEQAIRFAGLGFRSSKDANAWLLMRMPEHHCGLVVDIHIVMEHVHSSISGQDSIGRMDKSFKLKIKTLADAIAMTSFETKIPRYFSQSATHKVVKQDSSYFDTIPTFEEWDLPNSGYRTRLKEELVTFRAAHQDNIDESVERDSLAYALATMALTESVTWLEGFIVFLDDYHRDLAKAKFGSKKAWHVTTRLGRRMMMEIAVPRNGIINSFQVGSNDQICQRIFWSVMKSHDIMARYQRNSYKDDPTISSELVKFMAVNTGFEALEVLSTKMQSMENDVVAARRDAANASKAAASASNKADEVKKVCDLLQKRLAKLEK
jgi:hypothetical protein